MINALSSARNGIQGALSRFEKAAGSVASSGLGDDAGAQDVASTAAPQAEDLDSATVSMITARLAFRASLETAHVQNQMLADVVNLGNPIPPRR